MKARFWKSHGGDVVELGFVGLVDGRAVVLEDPLNEIRQYLMADQSGCDLRALHAGSWLGGPVGPDEGDAYLLELWRTFRGEALHVDLVEDDGSGLLRAQLSSRPSTDWASQIAAPHGFFGTCTAQQPFPAYLHDIENARAWIRETILDELLAEYVCDAVAARYARDAVDRLFPVGQCVLPTGTALGLSCPDDLGQSGPYALRNLSLLALADMHVFDEQDLYDILVAEMLRWIEDDSGTYEKIAGAALADAAEDALFGLLASGAAVAAHCVPGPLLLELAIATADDASDEHEDINDGHGLAPRNVLMFVPEADTLLELADIPNPSPALSPSQARIEAREMLGPREVTDDVSAWDKRVAIIEWICGPTGGETSAPGRLQYCEDAALPLLDRIPRELFLLAGVPWVDMTPIGPDRIMWIVDKLGHIDEALETELWHKRRDVIAWLARDLAQHDLAPDRSIDDLLGNPDAVAAQSPHDRGWGRAVVELPELRALLTQRPGVG